VVKNSGEIKIIYLVSVNKPFNKYKHGLMFYNGNTWVRCTAYQTLRVLDPIRYEIWRGNG
jgi:hypothetical protein